jgi:hypothetical protein
MANKKITDFTAAGALDGTELIEIVQGGVNKQTTTQGIANLGGATGVTLWTDPVNLPSTSLSSGKEWFVDITGGGDYNDGFSPEGVRHVNKGTILKYISTGLWRFIE